MTDFHTLLPNFPHANDGRYAGLLAGLETHRIGLSELLTLDAAEIGKRTRLPLLELQRFSEEVRRALAGGGEGGQGIRGIRRRDEDERSGRKSDEKHERSEDRQASEARKEPGGKDNERSEDRQASEERKELGGKDNERSEDRQASEERKELGGEDNERSEDQTKSEVRYISTLDDDLDGALGGGFPCGYVSEVVGESGAGKTQLLLSLLLAVQLPPPRGLGRHALYIATEAPLPTGRLTQMMRCAPAPDPDRDLAQHCSLRAIATINTPDLEAQDHILTHQLPVQLAKARGRFGLVVLDSVAANFRPFFGGSAGGGSAGGGHTNSLGARSLELTRLGMLLRSLAQTHNLAVVVANQVGDRFEEEGSSSHDHYRTGGPTRGPGTPRWSGNNNNNNNNYNSNGSAYTGNTGNTAKRARPSGPAILPPTQESPLAARSRQQQQQQQQPVPLPAGGWLSSQETRGAALSSSQLDSTQPPRQQQQPPPPAPPPPPLLPPSSLDLPTQYIPSSLPPQSQFPPAPPPPPVLQLDHQQRWFTGWGDDPGGGVYGNGSSHRAGPLGMRNKTPSLGLVWATQLAMRVALIKAPRIGRAPGEGALGDDDDDDNDDDDPTGAPRLRHSWRRWMKVVFAPHAPATGDTPRPSTRPLAMRMQGAVEFEITMGGLQSVRTKASLAKTK